MKSPPISPYGVFTGSLFQYSKSPSLIAFESPPIPQSYLSISSPPCSPSSQEGTTPIHSGGYPKPHSKKCILLGGLSDGPIPTPYSSLLEQKCHELGWSLVQPILSSSYLGFGNGSLSRDSEELGKLMKYLVCHHNAKTFALVGHSTGCQNSVHFLKYGEGEMIERLKVVVLQAPVSDRESITLSPGDHVAHLEYARNLVTQGKGEEMMPRASFWAPITALRYISLFDLNGDDDFFSSDIDDEQLRQRLGHVNIVGKNTGLQLLAAFSENDEYVPSWVDKELLLERLCRAMNDTGGGELKKNQGDTKPVAKGLMLKGANHNLSQGEDNCKRFVEAVGKLLKLCTLS